MDKELKYLVNTSYLIFNYLEDVFLKIKSNKSIIHSYKQNVNKLLYNLRLFNNDAENVLSQEIESFDDDKAVFQFLVQAELIAHTQNKQKEFHEYIKSFFKDGIQLPDIDYNTNKL